MNLENELEKIKPCLKLAMTCKTHSMMNMVLENSLDKKALEVYFDYVLNPFKRIAVVCVEKDFRDIIESAYEKSRLVSSFNYTGEKDLDKVLTKLYETDWWGDSLEHRLVDVFSYFNSINVELFNMFTKRDTLFNMSGYECYSLMRLIPFLGNFKVNYSLLRDRYTIDKKYLENSLSKQTYWKPFIRKNNAFIWVRKGRYPLAWINDKSVNLNMDIACDFRQVVDGIYIGYFNRKKDTFYIDDYEPDAETFASEEEPKWDFYSRREFMFNGVHTNSVVWAESFNSGTLVINDNVLYVMRCGGLNGGPAKDLIINGKLIKEFYGK